MNPLIVLSILIGIVLLLCLCWTLLRPPRMVVTVTRPTTGDGEQVQMTATVRRGASSQRLAATVQRLSLAIQFRQKAWNDYVAQETLQIEHGKWKRIREKLGNEASLSKEERNWWQAHGRDFDERGPLDRAKMLEAVANAAEDGG